MAKIVFFDGHCNLCNGLVDWLIKADRNKQFQFASLQGETAKKYFTNSSNSYTQELNTIVYLKNDTQFEKSTAVLNILYDLGGAYKVFKLLLYIPLFFRDSIYHFVAKNRYLLFGKRKTCRIPTIEEQERLLA